MMLLLLNAASAAIAAVVLPTDPAAAPALAPAAGPFAAVASKPSRPALLSPGARHVARANASARVSPAASASLQARQVYPFTEGALFEVYAAPDRVTDIVLQPGEALVGTGPVAAGDTVRWIIGDTESGAGPTKRIHILVKPTRPDLETNLIVNTDRRTYHLELRATARVAMSEVSWRYADDALVAVRRSAPPPVVEPQARPPAPSLDLGRLNFGYRLDGDKPAWRPLRVFDDGQHVVIDFPPDLGATDLPPLFAVEGKTMVLVNTRVIGRRLIADHLFQAAELRLGDPKGRQKVVRIVRQPERGQ